MSAIVLSSCGSRHRLATWARSPRPFALALCDYAGESFVSAYEPDFFLSRRGDKFPNYLALLERYPAILNHEYFAFIDDDVEIDAATIDATFRRMRAEGIDMAQPTLRPESEIHWEHLRSCDGLRTEQVNFVEIQCFFLSRRLLRRTLPFFYLIETGFGMDLVLKKIADEENVTGAVFHDLTYRHPAACDSVQQREGFAESRARVLRRLELCWGETIDIHRVAAGIRGKLKSAYPGWGVLYRAYRVWGTIRYAARLLRKAGRTATRARKNNPSE